MAATKEPAERIVEIAGMKFGISPVTGREGLRLLRRLSKSVLPAIGSALLATHEGKTTAERAGKLGRVLERFAPTVFQDLTEEEMDALVDKLLARAVYIGPGGREEVLAVAELIFTGKTLALLQLLWAAAAVCYADFFEGSLGAWAKAVGSQMKAEMKKATTEPEASDSKTSPPT